MSHWLSRYPLATVLEHMEPGTAAAGLTEVPGVSQSPNRINVEPPILNSNAPLVYNILQSPKMALNLKMALPLDPPWVWHFCFSGKLRCQRIAGMWFQVLRTYRLNTWTPGRQHPCKGLIYMIKFCTHGPKQPKRQREDCSPMLPRQPGLLERPMTSKA